MSAINSNLHYAQYSFGNMIEYKGRHVEIAEAEFEHCLELVNAQVPASTINSDEFKESHAAIRKSIQKDIYVADARIKVLHYLLKASENTFIFLFSFFSLPGIIRRGPKESLQ